MDLFSKSTVRIIWIKQSIAGLDDQQEDLYVAEKKVGGSLVDTMRQDELMTM